MLSKSGGKVDPCYDLDLRAAINMVQEGVLLHDLLQPDNPYGPGRPLAAQQLKGDLLRLVEELSRGEDSLAERALRDTEEVDLLHLEPENRLVEGGGAAELALIKTNRRELDQTLIPACFGLDDRIPLKLFVKHADRQVEFQGTMQPRSVHHHPVNVAADPTRVAEEPHLAALALYARHRLVLFQRVDQRLCQLQSWMYQQLSQLELHLAHQISLDGLAVFLAHLVDVKYLEAEL